MDVDAAGTRHVYVQCDAPRTCPNPDPRAHGEPTTTNNFKVWITRNDRLRYTCIKCKYHCDLGDRVEQPRMPWDRLFRL